MKINQDYMQVMRRGKWIDRQTYKKHHESASTLLWCLLLGLLTALLAMFAGCNIAYSDNYTDEQIATAIYHAEGGAKTKHPYGILSIKCTGEAECRKICLNTIKNKRKQWKAQNMALNGQRVPFLAFLASKYAPIGAKNDPIGLNNNWYKNVLWFLEHPKKIK